MGDEMGNQTHKGFINIYLLQEASWFSQVTNTYTLFQDGPHCRVLLFSFKLLLIVASFLKLELQKIFSLEQGIKGLFASKQQDTKMGGILE